MFVEFIPSLNTHKRFSGSDLHFRIWLWKRWKILVKISWQEITTETWEALKYRNLKKKKRPTLETLLVCSRERGECQTFNCSNECHCPRWGTWERTFNAAGGKYIPVLLNMSQITWILIIDINSPVFIRKLRPNKSLMPYLAKSLWTGSSEHF